VGAETQRFFNVLRLRVSASKTKTGADSAMADRERRPHHYLCNLWTLFDPPAGAAQQKPAAQQRRRKHNLDRTNYDISHGFIHLITYKTVSSEKTVETGWSIAPNPAIVKRSLR
jgi:hypothetical protein